MTNAVTTTLISADSHVTEPPDLWTSRIDRAYRERAPRYARDESNGALLFLVDGQIPKPVNVNIAVGQRPEDYEEFFKKGLEAARPGGWDPAARLEDMDVDGVEAAVLYTSQGFRLFALEDPHYQEACFRAYNDWLAEHCREAPKRLFGIAMISLFDVDRGVAELRRCHTLGHRGAMIWGSPPEELPFDDARYEPFWAEAAELQMPLSLHIATGGDVSARETARTETAYWNKLGKLVSLPAEIQRTLTTLIFSGVLDRHPNLRLVSAEYDMGWVPYYLQYADRLYRRWSPLLGLSLPMLPSEYFLRQVSLTFIREPIGMKMVAAGLLPADNVMWCDDYPHGASTWPHSRRVVDETMADLSESDRRKVVRGNASRLYGIEPTGKFPGVSGSSG